MEGYGRNSKDSIRGETGVCGGVDAVFECSDQSNDIFPLGNKLKFLRRSNRRQVVREENRWEGDHRPGKGKGVVVEGGGIDGRQEDSRNIEDGSAFVRSGDVITVKTNSRRHRRGCYVIRLRGEKVKVGWLQCCSASVH